MRPRGIRKSAIPLPRSHTVPGSGTVVAVNVAGKAESSLLLRINEPIDVEKLRVGFPDGDPESGPIAVFKA